MRKFFLEKKSLLELRITCADIVSFVVAGKNKKKKHQQIIKTNSARRNIYVTHSLSVQNNNFKRKFAIKVLLESEKIVFLWSLNGKRRGREEKNYFVGKKHP